MDDVAKAFMALVFLILILSFCGSAIAPFAVDDLGKNGRFESGYKNITHPEMVVCDGEAGRQKMVLTERNGSTVDFITGAVVDRIALYHWWQNYRHQLQIVPTAPRWCKPWALRTFTKG